MNQYISGALVAFVLFGMGLTALILGWFNLMDNKKAKSGIRMFYICACVFFWDFGYAWMSLCYGDDFAYIPRAMALLAVSFYIFFVLEYIAAITNYPKKRLMIFVSIFAVASLVAWVQIIQKDAVDFVVTGWGYWYYSKMSFARILQFVSAISGIVQYYVVLHYGEKRATLERDKYVYRRFRLFGPILFTGYMFDTLVPTLFKIPAIPGSSISAFFSAMILFRISQKNKVFGLSKANVSGYVFQDVLTPILITDMQGRIVLINDYATQYLKKTEEEIKTKQLPDFFSEADNIWKVNDQELECRIDTTEVKDQFGTLLYSIHFVNDITKEQQTLRMLQESREIAEEASQAKSNFLANMSHEIRTPMNAIIGMSQIIIQEGNIEESTLNQVKDIHAAGENLLGIINDILDISKIEAGKYELFEDTYEMASLIHDVSNIIAIRLQETAVAFRLKVDETLPIKLIGDEGRIRQILLNILGNAVKFVKEGSVTFNITWNHNPVNPMIQVDVADTGVGIKEEDMGKIFGAFNQVDTRRNRNIQGTGLGLAISKQLAELMNGDIMVDSVYGKGSTFHITIMQKLSQYIPMGAATARSLENRQYHADNKKTEFQAQIRTGKRVLIVDDAPMNLKVAKGLMKKYQMEIDVASSGREALQKVQEEQYDAIFMDHMMPEMDGIETARKIRELGEVFKNQIIIALTANVTNEAKELFEKEGFQDFVAKPIVPKQLDEVMNRWISVS